jgi:hypothetical protein
VGAVAGGPSNYGSLTEVRIELEKGRGKLLSMHVLTTAPRSSPQVPVRIELEKGRGKLLNAPPPMLALSGGEATATVCGGASNQPIVGRLCVGAAQVGFVILTGGSYLGNEWLKTAPGKKVHELSAEAPVNSH